MTEKTIKQKVKVLIIVLAVLLGINIMALAGLLIYNCYTNDTIASDTVPDNTITPVEDKTSGAISFTGNVVMNFNTVMATNNVATTASTEEKIPFYLNNKTSEYNQPFNVTNMFPGDKIPKYYSVKVSYHNYVNVRFKVDIREGYEKLAEVMKVKVTLLDTNEVKYDGLMKDMPSSVSHRLTSEKSTVDELNYAIIAYLDTSVGNEYMEQNLVADFKWWVEEVENLDPPKTSADSIIVGLVIIAGVSLITVLFFAYKKKNVEV